MPTPSDEGDFDRVFAAVDAVTGWLTREQARRLFEAVRALPARATVIEVGSHQGRSTIVLASARDDATVVAIDPFVDGWKFGGAATQERFARHVVDAGVADRIDLRVARSADVRRDWTAPVGLVFVDGKHDVVSTLEDLRWARHLPAGGRILVHDGFSSIGVTLALLVRLLPARDLRYVGRTGSLVELETTRPTAADRAAVVAQLPWWCRNVGLKILLRLRLRRVAARLGHHDRWDPY